MWARGPTHPRRAPRRGPAAAAPHRDRGAPGHVGAVRRPCRRWRARRLRRAGRRALAPAPAAADARRCPRRRRGARRPAPRGVDVLRYSFGGGLAQELAYRAAERARGLVLGAPAPGRGSTPPKPMAALMLATPARYYHPRLLELSVPHIAGGRTAREPGALGRHAGERLMHPPSALGYAYQLYAVAGWSSLPWLRSVTQPTL